MYMSGGIPSVKVVLRNPLNRNDLIDFVIEPNDSLLASDWIIALKQELISGKLIEKNFCFMGFPRTARNLNYLCNELNSAVYKINLFNRTNKWQEHGLPSYIIEDYFAPDVVRFGDEYPIGDERVDYGLFVKHGIMNKLHNHFEVLQGTVNSLSDYYKLADYETKYAIRQLNNICHELESLILSQRKQVMAPDWVRPSQITTFLHANRHDLKQEHREGFKVNGYDRVFGGVYMHWTQIGKTLFEVWRDENAPELTDTVCEAITELKYYSGEFDIEWAKDVVYGKDTPWHDEKIDRFTKWLIQNKKDPADIHLSLGYLPLGQVKLHESFGTKDIHSIWDILGNHLDIYKIEIGNISQTYNYCWTELDYKQMQINMMRPGYDYSSRG